MGYPVPETTLQFKLNGESYAVAAFIMPSPVGDVVFVGFFQKVATNDWNAVSLYGTYTQGLLDAVKAKGGVMGYIDAMLTALNEDFAIRFKPEDNTLLRQPSQPKDEQEALAAISAEIRKLKITVVNGIPRLSR